MKVNLEVEIQSDNSIARCSKLIDFPRVPALGETVKIIDDYFTVDRVVWTPNENPPLVRLQDVFYDDEVIGEFIAAFENEGFSVT